MIRRIPVLRSLPFAGALAILLAVSLGVTPTMAHGGAELTLSPAQVPPGGSVTVKGEGVEAGEMFTIHIEGVSYQATLGTVAVGDDGDFHEEFVIPTDTPPGTYQVRATSQEGEVLSTELSVVADPGPVEPAAAEPSAEPMQLNRTKSTAQWVVILAGILGSAALGLVLVRTKE